MWNLKRLKTRLEQAHSKGVFSIRFCGYIVPTEMRHVIESGYGRYVRRACVRVAA
jgi:hypothetical protein